MGDVVHDAREGWATGESPLPHGAPHVCRREAFSIAVLMVQQEGNQPDL